MGCPVLRAALFFQLVFVNNWRGNFPVSFDCVLNVF